MIDLVLLSVFTEYLYVSVYGGRGRTGSDARGSVVRETCRSYHHDDGATSHLLDLFPAHPACFAPAGRPSAFVMETFYNHLGEGGGLYCRLAPFQKF